MPLRSLLVRSCLLGLLLPAVLLAGKLTLKDGTVYEGTIKKLGTTSYTVKLADGTLKLVSASDVASVDDPTIGTPGAPGAAGKGLPGKPGAATGSDDFARTQRQADRIDTPLLGVTLWQKFVDTHPKDPDHAAGEAEVKRWQGMAKDGAEKVKGKWVTGDDLKKLHKQVDGMTDDAVKMIRGDQTIKGIAKLQEVLKIYPNSFPANFEMGYFNLVKITRIEGSNKLIDDSITSLETAVKLKPSSPEALTNLAIAYSFRRRYEDSVVTAYKAAQIDDSHEIVQNLCNALDESPPGMLKNNPKVVPIVSDAKVLMGRRSVSARANWTYVRPDYTRGHDHENSPGDPSRKGMVGSGSGFFVSADGFIMTNRHVAAAGDKMVVYMSDGTMKVAEKVVVDDEQDIAILKIDPGKDPLPFIRISASDEPNVGTDVTVMGFPLGAAMGMHVKITRGVVTSIEDGKQECDVIVDAQVNPGNSGGPMLDKYGNLLALVAMKTLAIDESISSYGLGISSGRLRKFFEHQKDKLTALKLLNAEKSVPTAALSTEDIAAKFTKATVMVLMYSGELPEGLK